MLTRKCAVSTLRSLGQRRTTSASTSTRRLTMRTRTSPGRTRGRRFAIWSSSRGTCTRTVSILGKYYIFFLSTLLICLTRRSLTPPHHRPARRAPPPARLPGFLPPPHPQHPTPTAANLLHDASATLMSTLPVPDARDNAITQPGFVKLLEGPLLSSAYCTGRSRVS